MCEMKNQTKFIVAYRIHLDRIELWRQLEDMPNYFVLYGEKGGEPGAQFPLRKEMIFEFKGKVLATKLAEWSQERSKK